MKLPKKLLMAYFFLAIAAAAITFICLPIAVILKIAGAW